MPRFSVVLLVGAALSFLVAFVLYQRSPDQLPPITRTPTPLSGAATELAAGELPTRIPTRTPRPTLTPLPTATPYPTPVIVVAAPDVVIEQDSAVGNADGCWTQYRVGTPLGHAEITGLISSGDDQLWAVGYVAAGEAEKTETLLLHWQDDEWQVVDSPNIGQGSNHFASISADGAGGIWIAGTWSDEVEIDSFGATVLSGDPLIAHWNGTDWRLLTSPLNFAPTSIVASGPDDFWALSSYDTGFTDTDVAHLLLHWQGSSWNMGGPSISVAAPGSYLRRASALGSDDLWAAGGQLIVHSDGENWDQTPFSLDSSFNILSIAATARDDAWAVGSIEGAQTRDDQPLIIRWNGTNWVQEIPDLPLAKIDGEMQAVAASSPSNVWAAGVTGSGADGMQSLLHWDGTDWNSVPVPPRLHRAQLNGLALATSGVWLAGYREVSVSDSSPGDGILLRYSTTPCLVGIP